MKQGTTINFITGLVFGAIPLLVAGADDSPGAGQEPDAAGPIILESSPADDQQGAPRRQGTSSDSYSEAEILPLKDGRTIIAYHVEIGDDDPLVSFDLGDVGLEALLDGLAALLMPKADYPAPITPAPSDADETEEAPSLQDADPQTYPENRGVFIQDETARGIIISLQVDKVSIERAIDRAAIESGCNIYIDGLKIVVDNCN